MSVGFISRQSRRVSGPDAQKVVCVSLRIISDIYIMMMG